VQTVAAKSAVAPFWFVTAGAVHVEGADAAPVVLTQAPIWGFARTVAIEKPTMWGGLVDLSATPSSAEVAALVEELTASDGEDQIALRGNRRYVARLTTPPEQITRAPYRASAGTYLVSGGLGALGMHAARWLVYKGARHLVLASRGARQEAATAEEIEALRRLGASVRVARVDVARAEDVARLLDEINSGPAPLRGIVHVAGLDLVRSVESTSPDQLREIAAAKVAGTWNLHTLTTGLDLFVCFSSISAVLGSTGRAAYSAANGFMDALAIERHRTGLPALSVNWGPWQGGGMATSEQLEQLARIGNRAMNPLAAIRTLDHLLQSKAPQASVVDIDWPAFRLVYEARRRRPILGEFGAMATPLAASQAVGSSGSDDLDLTSILREEAARTLGYDNALDLSLDRRFSDMGMDSLLAADYAGRLRKRLGHVPAGAVFDHPSVRALAGHLEGTLALAAVGGAPVAVIDASACPQVSRQSGMEQYGERTESEILEFQREAFPDRQPDLITPRWRWMFLDSARRLGVSPLFWFYRDQGRIVAQMGSIPVRVKIGTQVRTTGWLVDTMVLEDYRNQAIGSRLMLQAQEDQPFSLSLGQSAEMRQIQAHLGWTNVAPLQVYQFLVRPERVLKGKLPGAAATVAGIALRASSATRDLFRRRSPLRWRAVDRFDDRHDGLWTEAALDLTCAVIRDASYLNWKYVEQPGQNLLRLELVGDGDRLLGVAVWMIQEADENYSYRRAHLVDLVTRLSDADTLDSVLQSASAVAAEAGADSLTGMTTDTRLAKALARVGFMRRDPSRFLLVDSHGLESGAVAAEGTNWFITQGDSDIDRPW
jgi:NAD(P)-dependent dehydrogenase (short-subunit alcohol dehydrogenase family)